MTTITLELPEEILINFNGINEIRRTLYEDFIIAQRQRGNISLGRAAELLGVTYSELFNRLGEKGLSFINANPEELEESYQHFEKIMEQARQ
jgi:predicted HTH domain antitoxin